jgi:hypothetical protein
LLLDHRDGTLVGPSKKSLVHPLFQPQQTLGNLIHTLRYPRELLFDLPRFGSRHGTRFPHREERQQSANCSSDEEPNAHA